MNKEPFRVTLRDPSLPHQVVFKSDGDNVYISCNCLRLPSGRHESMGITHSDLDFSRMLYNDPRNHQGPFTKEDEAKW